ncbi:MAG TPA: hypothetical protein VHL98_14690 [Microvirga sp.]|jgi:hypothetical protein|nr:hypothetical protein [Microvirga sp.]
MAEDRSPSPTPVSDYDAIERAVAETERGRWFLNEFSRRNRIAETRTLLDAIARLEGALSHRTAEPERIRSGLDDMADLITETRARVAVAPFDSLEAPAHDPLAVVARTSRRVAATLTASADQIRDAAAALRHRGVDPDLCRAVERQAVEVSTTATIQNLAAQRIAVLADALSRLDGQVEALRALCAGDPAADPVWPLMGREPAADPAWPPRGTPTLVV